MMFQAVMLSWFRKRIIIPLKQIETAARDFDEKSNTLKNPEALVLDLPEIHTGDELESLSNTLSSMSYNMKGYVEDLLESAVKMDKLEHDLIKSKKRAKELGELATLDKHSPLFRVGGDEFIAILKGYDYENIESLVEEFKKEVEHLSNDKSLEPWERTSAAIGYALYDEKLNSSYETVFHRADQAMYECKKAMKALRE